MLLLTWTLDFNSPPTIWQSIVHSLRCMYRRFTASSVISKKSTMFIHFTWAVSRR